MVVAPICAKIEIYRKQLYQRLNKRYNPLLALLVPAHFIWQANTMWIMIKQRPTDDQTYEQVRKAILTPKLMTNTIMKRL